MATHSVICCILLTCSVLMLQSRTGNTAPTHHLTIGVEGDIPKLIITSSEVGITPRSMHAANTATGFMTKESKHNAQKLKNKSLKSQYAKKRQFYSAAKEKIMFHEKNISPAATTMQIPATVTTPTTALKTSTHIASTGNATPIEASTVENNQYTTTEVSAPSTTTATNISNAATSITQPPSASETDTTATLGNLPYARQTPDAPLTPTLSHADAARLVQTVAGATIVDVDSSTSVITTEDIKTLAATNATTETPTTQAPKITTTITTTTTATLTATTASPAPRLITMELVSAAAQALAKTTTTTPKPATTMTTAPPLITAESFANAANKNKTITTTAATMTTTYIKSSNNGDDDVATHHPEMVTSELATNTKANASRSELTTTQTPPATAMATPADRASDNLQPVLTSAATSPTSATSATSATAAATVTTGTTALPAQSSTQQASIILTQQQSQPRQHDGIIKLIDLEKHDLKSMDGLREPHRPHDDGHDGVKKTKKKQLIDKHFSVVDTAAIVTSAPVAHGNSVKVERPTALPTLLPVPNGYLGPIIMEEKTFSVIHANRNKQHQSAISSQLRDGRFVEIIAPTALLTQENATTTKITPTVTVLPTAKRVEHTQDVPVLSTTVFQVPEVLTSTTRLPVDTKLDQDYKIEKSSSAENGDRTESKISDIQIEVYDSTIDSIVASTNFKDGDGYFPPPVEPPVGTTKPPSSVPTQERFTQYVIDRTDSSTQESSLGIVSSGKPQPAAIEIHINVSEGFGNESEDLEFSYRQADYTGNARPNQVNNLASKALNTISMKPLAAGSPAQNDSNSASSEHNDEILVVEIIDTGDNSTDNSASSENVNPIFTFHTDTDADVELKDIKYFPPKTIVKPPHVSDELFLADAKKNERHYLQPPPPPPPPPRKPSIDHDSDTIFYISNTEVKVGESLPTANTNFEQQLRKARLESQFFPANYIASTHPNTAKIADPQPQQHHRFEEDIILSPLRNTADSLKIFRSQGDVSAPLDITYVGESVMEVEQSSDVSITTTAAAPYAPSQTPDVIIQPAILPELSIGVPVIGELPPQIELREIDFMPDEPNQQRSGVYENDIEETVNGNDVDRLVESSIQYGGDLIDESAGGGFDGVEGSYPFGNPVTSRRKANHNADYAHFSVNQGVNNLRKDELSVYVGGSMEVNSISNAENTTLKELLIKNGDDASMNISYLVAERMDNATAFSVMEEPNDADDDELSFNNLFSLIIGLVIVILPVVVTVSMACALRYLYWKYQSNDNSDNGNQPQANGTAGSAPGQTKESTEPPSPTQSANKKDTTTQNDKTMSTNESSKPSNSSSFHIVDEQSKSVTETPIKESKSEETNTKSQSVQSDSVPGNFTGPNGSITKMTLKNNHLIIETEERNDISRNARETKMHYNNSEKDGVFVVEVARGIDSKAAPENSMIDSQPYPIFNIKQIISGSSMKAAEDKVITKHEEVQIHQPPPEMHHSSTTEELQRSLHQIEEVEEPTPSPNFAVERAEHLNTGLSQSDLSSTSSTDSNKRYSYGNQALYVIDQRDYAAISPTAKMPPASIRSSNDTEDDDRKSENGHSLGHSPSQTNENGTGPNGDKRSKEPEGGLERTLSSNAKNYHLNGFYGGDKEQENTQPEGYPDGAIKNVKPTEKNNNLGEIPLTTATAENPAVPNNEDNGSQVAATQEFIAVNGSIHNDSKMNVCNGNIYTETDADTEVGVKANADAEGKAETAGNTTIDIEPEGEPVYDSIMSLPDPPSTDEITELNECSVVDTNQLDSLPPPPPPLHTDANDNENVKKIVSIQAEAPPILLTNGNTDILNGHADVYISTLPPPIEVTSNGKLLPAPLTPPASPPPSPPAHFSNGVNGVTGINGGLCASMQMAVDVNGS